MVDEAKDDDDEEDEPSPELVAGVQMAYSKRKPQRKVHTIVDVMNNLGGGYGWVAGCKENGFSKPRPQSPPVSFVMMSTVKLVGKTHLGCLVINGKSKMAERGQMSN